MNFLKTAVLCVAFASSAVTFGFTLPEVPDIDLTRTKTTIIISKTGLIELLQYANTLSELKNDEKECLKDVDSPYNRLDFITDLMPPLKPEVSSEDKIEISINEFDTLIDYIRYLRRQLKPKIVFCSDV